MSTVLSDWLAGLAATPSSDEDVRELTALAPLAASQAESFLQFFRIYGEASDAEPLITQAMTPPDGLTPREIDLVTLGDAVALCFASVGAEYGDRRSAIAARERVGLRCDAAYRIVGQAFGAETLAFLVDLTGETVKQISTRAANLAPVVRVTTAAPLPSSLAAYDLYENAERGAEIVSRNRLSAPLILPERFEALAS